MKIGYARVSKADGTQNIDLQKDTLLQEGIKEEHIYYDYASGQKEKREGLENCLKALREGDVLVVWKLDRLGRSLKHLVNIVQDLINKKIGFKVIAGHGANIDTSTANGKLIFGIFASLSEFERELIRERTKAGLLSARARGKKGGRKFKLTKSKVKIAQMLMKNKAISISDICKELGGISKQCLYKYVAPNGELRDYGKQVLSKKFFS